MPISEKPVLTADIVALPETAGSALYGLVDVLAATGTLWRELVGEDPGAPLIKPRVVGLSRTPFRCGNGIPVEPDLGLADAPQGDILILPELWLGLDDDMRDRYGEMKDWVRARYHAGGTVYSSCSGAVLLAATGLLDGREATCHWGFQDLFRTRFPKVRFRPDPNLVFAEADGRIVTAGGTTAWHDLAIHIISRHCGTGEALKIAKVYLLKWHDEGQLPYASLVRRHSHADAAVRRAENWLRDNFRQDHAVSAAVDRAGLPERTLKPRCKMATRSTPIAYVQNLRIEESKRLLESGDRPFEEIAADVGYENPAFFRRLFKRATGLTPAHYRRLFKPNARRAGHPAATTVAELAPG